MDYYKNIPNKSILWGIPVSLLAVQYYLGSNKETVRTIEDAELEEIDDTELIDLENRIEEMSLENFSKTVNSLKEESERQKECKIFLNHNLPTIDKASIINDKVSSIYLEIENYLKKIKEFKPIFVNEEFKKNFPKHITINGNFTNIEYEKVYTSSELLRNKIFDYTLNINEKINLISWFKNKEEIDQIFKLFENQDVKNIFDIKNIFEAMNYSFKYIPQITKKNEILLSLENLVSNFMIYQSEVNITIGIIDYIVNSGMQENMNFIINNKNIKLLECNNIIKQNLNNIKLNIIKKIKDIIKFIDNIIWLDLNQLDKI